MFGRHRRAFLSRLDRERLEAGIREAERGTTADVRVAVLPHARGKVAKIAGLTAHRLGMTRAPERNGVLVVVLPGRREFHVWGDRAIHERVGDAFWRSVADAIAERFRAGDYTAGLLAAIERIAPELAAHFPARPGASRHALRDGVVEE